MNFIKCVMVDLDGCLNSTAIGRPLDLISLHKLQQINQEATTDPTTPFMTINTGRYLQYTEAFAQILDLQHFFSYEYGAAIAKLEGARIKVILNPALTLERRQALQTVREEFMRIFPQYEAFIQRGKEFMITCVFEVNSPEIPSIAEKLTLLLKKGNNQLQMDVGHNFINIYYPDIDKASGLQLFLNQESRIDSSEIAGIGDSMSDWNFVQHCGYRACPANADPRLKEKCDYIASQPEAAGILEIIHKIRENNRRLTSLKP